MDFCTGSSSTDAWSERRTSHTGIERGRLESYTFGRHHSFSPDRGRGHFYELLRQLAEEHEKALAEKVSQKTAENTRLRFRLVSKEARTLAAAAEARRRAPCKKDTENELAPHGSEYSPSHGNQLSPTTDFAAPQGHFDKDVVGVSRSPVNSMCLPGVLRPQGSAATLTLSRLETESTNLELSPVVPTPHSTHASSTPRLEKGDSEVMTAGPDETFDLRDEWQDTRASSRRMVSSRTLLSTTAVQQKPPNSHYQIYDGVLKRFISSPSSPFRVTWDALGALFIFYDMVIIPLRVFDFPESLFIDTIDWFALVFWTLNMFSSFLVGYLSKGITIMAPQKIALHYLRTWFPLDVIVLAQDWAFTAARIQGGSNNGQSVRLVRILRLIRTVRLLRLFKLRWMLAGMNDWVESEYTSILLSILKMIVLLLSINHFIACAWYLVAKLSCSSSSTGTWITIHGFGDTHWFYQYLTAFHWSITQFTPASMDVQAQNVAERLFAVAVVVFALVGFSYVVGSITSSLGQIRGMQEEAQKQFWNVRRYLKKNQVPAELALRITKYLEHAWQRHKRHGPLTGIKLFNFLSEQLHNELQLSMSVPHLIVHPLFAYLQHSCLGICSRLANTAISRKLLAQHDTVFYPGESATHMYFVVQGRLRYTRVDPMGEEHVEMVDKGEDWISEPVLWTGAWVHLGALCAETEGDLLLVNAVKFNSIISLNPGVYRLVSCYALRFVDWINHRSPAELSDVVQGEHAKDVFKGFIPATEDELLTQMSFRPK